MTGINAAEQGGPSQDTFPVSVCVCVYVSVTETETEIEKGD